jgi:integrase
LSSNVLSSIAARSASTVAMVFSTANGRPIEPRNLKRSFDKRCKLAGVRQIKIHDTRRSCGSLLSALDVHPRIAMQILRHSRISMTMEIYTQMPDQATRDALGKLSDWLDQADDTSPAAPAADTEDPLEEVAG